jgi:hypothetical protein
LTKAFLFPDPRHRNQLPQFPDDVPVLESAATAVAAKLIVIDPITSFVRGSLHNDQSARAALAPMADLARKLGAAVLVVRHVRKAATRNPLHIGAGTIGIVALARSSLLIGDDPASNDPYQHILALNKSNLASAPSLLFRTVRHDTGVITVEWLGETDVTATDLARATVSSNEPSALQEAMYVLYSLLSDGPLPANEVAKRASAARVAGRTLSRAKAALGVKSIKSGSGKGSCWYWRLPVDDKHYRVFKEQDLDRLMDQLCHGYNELELPDEFSDPRCDRHSRPNDGDEDGAHAY